MKTATTKRTGKVSKIVVVRAFLDKLGKKDWESTPMSELIKLVNKGRRDKVGYGQFRHEFEKQSEAKGYTITVLKMKANKVLEA